MVNAFINSYKYEEQPLTRDLVPQAMQVLEKWREDKGFDGDYVAAKEALELFEELGMEGAIEDILITLTHQYHIIRPVAKHNGLFIYYVLDRNRANLAMARRKVQDLEAQTML